MTLSSNLTTFSDVTDGAPLSPVYLNSKFNVLDKNTNEMNSSRTVEVSASETTGAFGTITGQFRIKAGSVLDKVQIGATTDHHIDIFSNETTLWQFHKAGHFSPVVGGGASQPTQDIGFVTTSGVTLSVRTVFLKALYSLGTYSTPSGLGDSEMGLVLSSSGMSLLVRSLDTVYDLGSATSAAV